MSNSTPKSLPEVPLLPGFPKLNVQANLLLRTLIRRTLDEEGLDDSWTTLIEGAVADLGESVESGQWLPGLKMKRTTQNNARAVEEMKAREQTRKDRERLREAKSAKAKGSEQLAENEGEKTKEPSQEERRNLSLREIHTLTSIPSLPSPKLSPKHLVLTVAPYSTSLNDSDLEFDILPPSKRCSFQGDSYSLPFFEDDQGKHGEGGIIICGLDSWDIHHVMAPRVVGGNFTFHNLTSDRAYYSLITVLKLSVYTYLSLILEQHLLTNSHIALQYPAPPSPHPSPSVRPPPTPVIDPSSNSPSKRKTRNGKASSGIWSFLSKKTEGIIHRVAGGGTEVADETLPRSSSIDLGSVFSSSKASWRTQRNSDDGTRTAVTRPAVTRPAVVPAESESESASNTVKASHARVLEEEERRDRERFGPFTSALRRIQDQHCVLSTSPNVSFPLPPLLVRLAQRETELQLRHGSSASSSSGSSMESSSSSLSVATVVPPSGSSASRSGPPRLRLTGVEKTGLGSVLGWEGREERGRGMVGVRSFVRHQGLTVLYAEHVSGVESGTPCGRPRWISYRYWTDAASADADADRTLGEMVERVCEAAAAEEPCGQDGCDKPLGNHAMSWTCAGVRIGGAVLESKDDAHEGQGLTMWETCAVCGQSTKREQMDDGTYLFSFAKFLELLIWSPMLASLSLCEHTTPPMPSSSNTGETPLPESRFHILRHFAHQGRILTFTLTSINNDMYEIRVPKLQVIAGPVPKKEKQLSEERKKREGEEERQALLSEIDEWWKGIKARLDKLDGYLEKEAGHTFQSKDLPPLPMSDDEDLEDDTQRSRSPDRADTSSPSRPWLPRSTSLPLASMPSQAPLRPSTPRSKSSKPAAPYPPGSLLSIQQSRHLLGQLRMSFQRTEDALRKQVSETPVSSLNDARRTFRSTARGAFKRLTAWQKKHAPSAPSDVHAASGDVEPEWWRGTCHAVPGGRVVVREGEWGSVIAFTLTSLDYQRELAILNSSVAPPLSAAPSTTTIAELPSPTPTAKALKAAILGLDPDETDARLWEEPEAWTAAITRREHPREVSALLSLRDVLRNKRSFDSSSLGSRFSGSVSRGIANFTPPSAWASPQVKVNLEPADGHVSQFPEAAEAVERVLGAQHPTHHEVDVTSSSDHSLSTSGVETPTPSGFVEKNIRSGKASSILSSDHVDEDDRGPQSGAPAIPLKNDSHSHSTPISISAHNTEPSSGTSSSSFSGALTSAMRYLLNTGSPSPSRSSSPAPSGPHHGLLALETSQVDDRPHIKYDWTIGKRLKFSCTVYYAKQFDALRKRCGVDDIMLKSLERSENWTAVGGKSKSNFWKSSDDRFIIKTLVNAWNVADLQVLIDLAPSYFRYIDSTASKASVLAKLMGFYTIEVKNLETGTVQAKHDLLVMENLFYGQKVSRTFDLKGMQSRRVKPNGDGPEQRTLFDAEWIEGQQRAPVLIQPHSRLILSEAVKADADFLAKSNIMDYSLLLGIDEERHEIACGLVDTIGSYTFAKTLEYKAKQNLNSGKGKEVTVVPPAEYHNRFVTAIEGYFLACPDKWTKPSHYTDRMTPHDLASPM